MKRKIYTADFETTTNPDDCRVWATGVCDISNLNFEYGNSIDFLFKHFEKNDGAKYLFHNLKFDCEFILYELFKRGYKYVRNSKDAKEKTFTTLISDMGLFYSCKIFYGKNEFGKLKSVTIEDSLKLINMPVAEIPKAFGLDIKKLDIVYTEDREVGHELTNQEIKYLKNDVMIVAMALNKVYELGMKKMTQGSCALDQFKKTFSKRQFNYYFPNVDYCDDDIRQSYKGGFTWCNPLFQNQDIAEGIVLDVNSLYPYVMYDKMLPYGEPKFFEGKYEKDEQFPLYVQMITCNFELKKDHVPTIQIKNNPFFNPNEYLSKSQDNYGNEVDVTLCLTSIDLKLFLEHYDVYNLTYHSGWKFKQTDILFKNYIDYWYEIKQKATLEENWALRSWAKIMLNSLYGKFSTSPKGRSKYPVYDESDGMIHYVLGEEEKRNSLYIPVGSFITSYARELTIRSAQKCYDRILYCDTDSLHLIGTDLPEQLEIDNIKLGAWKVESEFRRARFIRQKSYVEEIKTKDKKTGRNIYKLKVTCAGMQKYCHKNVTFENFKNNSVIEGQLKAKRVKGGIVLMDDVFTIRM